MDSQYSIIPTLHHCITKEYAVRKYIAILGVILAVAVVTGLVTGDVRTAEYKGSKMCGMCHRLMHKEIVEAYEMTAHPKGMQKADAEGAIVADFSTNPAFTKDKVAYVLGKGRHEQAFLDADFQVLPAVWDVKAKKWKPKQAVDGATQCIGCHSTGYDAAEKTFAEAGIGCEGCHGPGSEHMAGDKTAIVNPKKMDKPKQAMVCGQCHSAGKDPTGKFAFPVGFRPGDDLTKVLADAKPTAPGPNQQYSEWLMSKHVAGGTDCAACHDPHNVTLFLTASKPPGGLPAQVRKPVNDLCLGCHAGTVKDIATHAPGAAADVTCGACHMHGGQHTFAKIDK